MNFKKCNGHKIKDLKEYILNYLLLYPDVLIYIGTDCKRRKQKYNYVTTICFRRPGNGIHIIYERRSFQLKEIKSLFEKLWKEVVITVEILEEITKYVDKSKIVIDLDYTVLEKHDSIIVTDSATGWIKGLGVNVRTKPNAWAASCAADYLVNRKS